MKIKVVTEIEMTENEIQEFDEEIAENLWCDHCLCEDKLMKQHILTARENNTIENTTIYKILL